MRSRSELLQSPVEGCQTRSVERTKNVPFAPAAASALPMSYINGPTPSEDVNVATSSASDKKLLADYYAPLT